MNSINKKDGSVQHRNSIECYEQLSEISNSYLIDVRTKPEWMFVGVPDLSYLNKETIFISWHEYPKMNFNKSFENQLDKFNLKKNDHIFFICRSGRRSFDAAKYLSSCKYIHCYNVADGFEGDKDTLNHRSNINGWKFNNLPWKQ